MSQCERPMSLKLSNNLVKGLWEELTGVAHQAEKQQRDQGRLCCDPPRLPPSGGVT